MAIAFRDAGKIFVFSVVLVAGGCGGGSSSSPSNPASPPPPVVPATKYFGFGSDSDGAIAPVAQIDRMTNSISVLNYVAPTGYLPAEAGTYQLTANGFLNISLTLAGQGPLPMTPPVPGSWGVLVPGEAALLQFNNLNGATTTNSSIEVFAQSGSCPFLAGITTFEYVTIPSLSSNLAPQTPGISPETAFGTVD